MIKGIFYLITGMLLLYGCGKESGSGDSTLNEYKQYLSNLPKSDYYSISKGISEYKQKISSAHQDIKDSAFVEFRNHYYNVINSCSENFWNNQGLINKLTASVNDDEVNSFKKKLSDNGLRLSTTEGNFYIDEQPDFLLNTFTSYVSPASREYLELRKKELEQGFSEDANLVISFRELGERIITWENYIKKYPNSSFIAEAKFSYHLYINTFITGLDNFPLSVDNKLKPEIKSEYEYFVSQHKGSEAARLIENYYNILAGQDFVLSPELQQFYEDNGIEAMQGIQPPTR